MAEEIKEEKKVATKKVDAKKEEKLVPVYVPIDSLNPQVKFAEVYVQDRKWRLPRGKTSMVPEAVKQVVEESESMIHELDNPEVEGLKYEGQEV